MPLPWRSESERHQGYLGFCHLYNHRRGHVSLEWLTPHQVLARHGGTTSPRCTASQGGAAPGLSPQTAEGSGQGEGGLAPGATQLPALAAGGGRVSGRRLDRVRDAAPVLRGAALEPWRFVRFERDEQGASTLRMFAECFVTLGGVRQTVKTQGFAAGPAPARLSDRVADRLRASRWCNGRTRPVSRG